MRFTLQTANVKADAKNSFYPNRVEVTDAVSLQQAVVWDHVCAQYRNNHRGNEDFIRSNVLVMDLDNDHSEDPDQWITAEKLDEMYPNTCYALAPSRHHMLPKNGKAPRPKYHVYFPVDEITDAGQYAAVKAALFQKYPFFDGKALDAARFIFGSDRGGIVWHDGWMSITEDLEEEDDCGDISPLIQEGGRNNAVFHKAVSLLKRYGVSDDSRTRFLEEADRCNPPLEKEELKTIWHSAKKYYRKIAAQPDYVKPDAYNGKVLAEVKWEEPIPFGKYRKALFPVKALPDPIAAYVSAVAEDTQTAPDMAGTIALSILSACMQGKFRIQGKPTWIEPVNLYSLVIAPSSERKSSVLKVMLRPMNEYEKEHNKGIGARMEANRMQKRILDRRQKMVEDLILKGKADAQERDRIAAEIDAFEEVRPLKLYVDDITTEKLIKVMSENKGRAAMISSEAGIFDMLAGIYTRSVNIDVMLKGYSGDPIRVERVGREGECITDPSLTVLLMAQPLVIETVFSNKTFRGRGLTARFLYCLPESMIGKRSFDSCPVQDSVYRQYAVVVKDLLDDPVPDEPEMITLSEDATKLMKAFSDELEPKLIREYAEIEEWVGKLLGNTLRIAGLLCRAGVHRCNDFLDIPDPLVVDGPTMERAVALGKYYISHAQAVFSVLPEDAMYQNANRILSMIREKGITEIDRRQVMRGCKCFKRAADVQPVLEFLEEYGYIAEIHQDRMGMIGRPPAPRYDVNPYFLGE